MFFLKKVFFIVRVNKFAGFSFAFLLFFFFVALFADELAPYSFSKVHPEFLKLPPAWMEGGNMQFLLGTDDLGRDFLSRLIYGARISISLGLMVVFLSVLIGGSLGLVAGYYGGLLDRIVVSVVDIMMSFPSILLAILIVAISGPGLFNTIIALNIVALPAVIRLVRGETLKEKNKEYVSALKGVGAGSFYIVFKHILPNVSGSLIVQAVLGFSDSILNISALGFLGLGARPPLPEWGVMISDGRDLMTTEWWLVVFPGLCIFIVVLCFNIFGGVLRDSFDSKT